MVICYIRAVSTSAQSGRMRMLSRVVSTTEPKGCQQVAQDLHAELHPVGVHDHGGHHQIDQQRRKTPSAAAYRITFLISSDTLPSASCRNSTSDSSFSSSVGIFTSMPLAVWMLRLSMRRMRAGVTVTGCWA